MAFVLRVLVSAFAIWITSLLVGGFEIVGGDTAGATVVVLLVVAFILAVGNAGVKPIVAVLSFPLYVLTLGLFTLVVNALMLLLTAWITSHTDWGLRIDGFWTAVWSALLVSIVSFFTSLAIGRRDKD
ncbi:putative membrane protein [Flavimobilis soli]|uniref:Putative membrane protein n=1 Tax=Flavimobilis soli TaxID=442709 RepID=A0A2A9EEI2_9MICO|nr:phage holin family protein [Flavimobilis soli]PFG37036.1 putative membrane protein [Flavimobilis soli]